MTISNRLLPRFTSALIVVALVVMVVSLVHSPGARALTGTVGPVQVEVTPTDNLASGDTITINATMTSPATLTEIRAHICSSSITSLNQFNWSYQGDYCVTSVASNRTSGSLGANAIANYETFSTFPNSASGSITFTAGTGTVTWNDETPGVPGGPDTHTVTCNSSSPCALVVRFQDSVGAHFFRADLTYAGGGGPTTTTSSSTTTTSTTTTTPPTTTTTTTAPPTTTTTTLPPGTTTTTTTAPPTTTTTSPPGTTTTTTTAPPTTTTTSPPGTTTTTTTPTTSPPTTTTTTAPPTTTSTTTLPTTTTTIAPGPIQLDTSSGGPGASFTVTSDTWKPGSDVGVTFHSDPVDLGKLTASDDGEVSGQFAVPAVEPGAHTVELTGTGVDDEPQTLTSSFTVTADTPTTTLPVTGTTPPSTSAAGSSNGALAFTGASTRDLLSIAALLLAIGLHFMALHRRRTATA